VARLLLGSFRFQALTGPAIYKGLLRPFVRPPVCLNVHVKVVLDFRSDDSVCILGCQFNLPLATDYRRLIQTGHSHTGNYSVSYWMVRPSADSSNSPTRDLGNDHCSPVAAFSTLRLTPNGEAWHRSVHVYPSSFNAAKPCGPPKSDVGPVLPSRSIAFFNQCRALC
jgi:hypothetical protein